MEMQPTASLIRHFEELPDLRQDHAAENLAVLHHMALNLLKHEKTA
jgi:predicted transposase YbfD/YdcC